MTLRTNISLRAYYLWEDDKKYGQTLLSEYDYWRLACNIEYIIQKYSFFKDCIGEKKEYDECAVCLDYLAKIACVECTQAICGRCLTKIKKCPFCRNLPAYKN